METFKKLKIIIGLTEKCLYGRLLADAFNDCNYRRLSDYPANDN